MSIEYQATRPAPTTTIQSLPDELLLFISSQLEETDLFQLSLATKTLRAFTVPELFGDVHFNEVEKHQAGKLRDCIAALSGNEGLCQVIKHVRIRLRWTWINSNPSDFSNLRRVLSRADLRSVHIDFRHYDRYHDSEGAVFAGYVSLWSTISKLPDLLCVNIAHPLDFNLELQEFPALQRIQFRHGQVDDPIGRLPRLTHLSLYDFFALDSAWLNPRLIRSLEVLRICAPGLNDLNTVVSSFQSFAKNGVPSALNAVCLAFEPQYDWQYEYDWLSRSITSFLSSLGTQTFVTLRSLEIRSLSDRFLSSGYQSLHQFLRFLAARIPLLEELVVMRAREDAEESVIVSSQADLGDEWADHLAALAGLIKNWKDGHDAESPEISAFETFPNLLYFAIRANHKATGDAWILDKTDEESIERGPVKVVEPKLFLDEAFDLDPAHQVSKEFSMDWYRKEVRELRAGIRRE
ncbi:uncharacterized protein JCM6883_003158 [Sporobolomyces salmoneus]|uniref:uncharacterized protein n=1 Tax=Sporobolomyces salmoneus TaxID=183962 RepID=UPI003180D6DF